MTDDLAVQMPEGMSLVKGGMADVFDDYVTTSEYIPRIQLMTGNSGLVQQGNAQVGEYVFINTKDDFTPLGKEVDILVCSWRLKAMQVGDGSVVSVFDPADPNFGKIRAQASVKDSGCMCGVEFLLWIPAVNAFATFYMASKSAQREAKKVRSFIDEENNAPGPATLKAAFIETKRFKWHAPVVTTCSTPFSPPEPEAFLKTLDKFLNPPKETDAEMADDDGDNRER